MKRILILAGISILGALAVCGAYVAFVTLMPTDTTSAPPPLPREKVVLYDVDAMAARMHVDKDYYTKVRDQALAFYKSQHPAPAAYDDQVKASIKLASYYVTWGDLYGERVLLDLSNIEEDAEHMGCNSAMLYSLNTDGWDEVFYPSNEPTCIEIDNRILAQAQDGSPVAFKFWGAQETILATLQYNSDKQTLRQNTPSMQMLPKVIALWERSLTQLIKDKAPNQLVYEMPAQLLNECECDESTMNLVIAAIDQAYNEAGSDAGQRVALDAGYFIEMAWVARGSGYANTVSDAQFQGFGERLRQAQQILEAAYVKHPDEVRIPALMIKVAMGESMDRETMETWFQRGVKIDPNYFDAYHAKEWYLQPRWCGSVDDEWKFVQECVATQNWDNKIPMILARGLDSVADNGDPDIFAHNEVWKLVNATYRKYLDQCPRSSRYRTFFLRAAYLGHHQEVVAEQYKILGTNWDNQVLSRDEYKAITASLGL